MVYHQGFTTWNFLELFTSKCRKVRNETASLVNFYLGSEDWIQIIERSTSTQQSLYLMCIIQRCRHKRNHLYVSALGFPGGSMVKNLPVIQETQEMRVWALAGEDPLEKVKVKPLSHVWLFVTSWTIQFMEFSRPEYWSG